MKLLTKKQVAIDRPQKPKTIVVINPQLPTDEVEAKIEELFAEKKQINEQSMMSSTLRWKSNRG